MSCEDKECGCNMEDTERGSKFHATAVEICKAVAPILQDSGLDLLGDVSVFVSSLALYIKQLLRKSHEVGGQAVYDQLEHTILSRIIPLAFNKKTLRAAVFADDTLSKNEQRAIFEEAVRELNEKDEKLN